MGNTNRPGTYCCPFLRTVASMVLAFPPLGIQTYKYSYYSTYSSRAFLIFLCTSSPVRQLFEKLFCLRVHVHAPFHRRGSSRQVGVLGCLEAEKHECLGLGLTHIQWFRGRTVHQPGKEIWSHRYIRAYSITPRSSWTIDHNETKRN